MSDDTTPKATPKRRGRPVVHDFSVDTLKTICDYIKGNEELFLQLTRPQLFERMVKDTSLDYEAEALTSKFARLLYLFRKHHDEETGADWPYYDLFNDLNESVLKHKRRGGVTPHKPDVEKSVKKAKPETAMTDKPKAAQRAVRKRRVLTPPPNPFLSLNESVNGKEDQSPAKVPKPKTAPKPTDALIGATLGETTPAATPIPRIEKRKMGKRVGDKAPAAVDSTDSVPSSPVKKPTKPSTNASDSEDDDVYQPRARKQKLTIKKAKNVSESTEPQEQPTATPSLNSEAPVATPSASPEVTEPSVPELKQVTPSTPPKKRPRGRPARKATAAPVTKKVTDKPPKKAPSTGPIPAAAPLQKGKVAKKSKKKKSLKSYLKKQSQQQQQITELMKNFMEVQKLAVERQAQGVQLPPNAAIMDDAVLTTIRSQQTELGTQLKKLENLISKLNSNK
ncbi:hypothetical protein IWQ62_006394 [Dispira parvispora]|uniref:Uncharacterized protein n=1 Tax=Dispira parvispora TaxID=1520584 RepID=A0A9W8E3T3_9FUNG|nr:hypothetical protein IWQ62_006394 [Dispira parvispora]